MLIEPFVAGLCEQLMSLRVRWAVRLVTDCWPMCSLTGMLDASLYLAFVLIYRKNSNAMVNVSGFVLTRTGSSLGS